MASATKAKGGGVTVAFEAEEVEALLHAAKGSILHDVYLAVKALGFEHVDGGAPQDEA